MDSLTFLKELQKQSIRPVFVVHGDEAFLKRQVLSALRNLVLENGDDFGLGSFAGDKVDFATVNDELHLLPFVGPRRLVVVEQADKFVSEQRARLERYVEAPSSTGVLTLEVKTWPATTKLAKLIPEAATIAAKSPPAYKLADWCISWAAARYNKKLANHGARLLVELAGPEMGVLDQELAKLSAFVGAAEIIEAKEVDALVGNNRAETVWKIFDFIAASLAREALATLDRLFEQGEDPIRLAGAFSMKLRQLAQVGRLVLGGQNMQTAMAQAGVPPFGQKNCELQLKHLGRRRLLRLYDWLLELDLGLKGSSQLSPRTQVERLVVRLVQPAARQAN